MVQRNSRNLSGQLRTGKAIISARDSDTYTGTRTHRITHQLSQLPAALSLYAAARKVSVRVDGCLIN